MSKQNVYTDLVHKARNGNHFVGEWSQERGQYHCPMSRTDAKATGCSGLFWRPGDHAPYSYLTRRQALAAARRLFGDIASLTDTDSYDWDLED